MPERLCGVTTEKKPSKLISKKGGGIRRVLLFSAAYNCKQISSTLAQSMNGTGILLPWDPGHHNSATEKLRTLTFRKFHPGYMCILDWATGSRLLRVLPQINEESYV